MLYRAKTMTTQLKTLSYSIDIQAMQLRVKLHIIVLSYRISLISHLQEMTEVLLTSEYILKPYRIA